MMMKREKSKNNIGCVLMASGESKRFGSNKLLAKFAGKPLFAYALNATNIPGLERVVVTRTAEVSDAAKVLGIPAILHDFPNRSDAIKLGIEGFKCDRIMFCPSDQPLLKKESVEALIKLSNENPSSICRLSFDGTPGAPVIFPSMLFAELSSLAPGQNGRDVIEVHKDIVLYQNAAKKEELLDVDTPEELKYLESLFLAELI